MPIKCDKCKMFGHTQEQCRKQENQRKEWRVKAPVSSPSTAQPPKDAEPRGEDVYGRNLDEQRVPLWEDIESIAMLLEDPWCSFKDIVKQDLTQRTRGYYLKALQHILTALKHPLKKLNRNKFADIYQQQTAARNELLQIQAQLQHDPVNPELLHKEVSCRAKYVSINHSAMLLIKQQSKTEWISFGDECTRVFIAKMKQRKAWTSIYHIRDQHD
ncbi:hypothetical protein Cgig2_029098 [Carnegiea gigantea]|uniref:Uncharacterized protein n=1 Tax=Carnegiea gigantea TaxID=171969 RepID=A0A9Q1JFN5_9CARY|nr:hypothetical protein Cgig2_029098 [Carnegiea gigantea]